MSARVRTLLAALVLAACSKAESPAPPPPAPPPPPPAPVVRDAGPDATDAAVDAPPDGGGGPVKRPAKKAAAPANGGGSGGFKVEGKLPKGDVEKVVRAGMMPKLRACYTAARAKQADLKGRVVFKLTIDDRGRVTLGEVVTSTLGGGDPEMCMVQATRDFKFPKGEGESTVSFQMTFN